MTAPRGSNRRLFVRAFMKSACATNWRVNRHATYSVINLIVIRVLTRQVWKLHQKVARKISRTLKNVWLLNDLALFQSDERLIINLLQVVSMVIMAGRSPPTVYAFLNPKFPSATWDFFCPRFDLHTCLADKRPWFFWRQCTNAFAEKCGVANTFVGLPTRVAQPDLPCMDHVHRVMCEQGCPG